VIPEVHLVGEENVSLQEDQHAAGEAHPHPDTQEKDEGELEVVQPEVGLQRYGLNEGDIGKVKSSFNGEEAPGACGEDFSAEEYGKEDAEQTQSEGTALGKPEGLPCPGHLLVK